MTGYTTALYSPEELSMLLGEHDANQLSRFGCTHYDWCVSNEDLHDLEPKSSPCPSIEQARTNETYLDDHDYDHLIAYWFFLHYESAWSPEDFLKKMMDVGVY